MRLYHGTTESVARKAMTEGLLTREDRGGVDGDRWEGCPSSEKHVYLTAAYAAYFASVACGDGDERLAIIEIDTDLLPDGTGDLMPDEDFLEQATRGQAPPQDWDLPAEGMEERTKWFRDRLHWFSHLWERSVEGMGNCAHEGSIPPEAITRVAIIDPRRPENKAAIFMAADPSISILNYRFMGGKYRALTRWFMGEPMTEEDALHLVGGFGIPSPMPPEFQQMFAPQIDRLRSAMSDQTALEIL